MKKKRIKFSEGGDIPDIPREPLRDSSGRRVRSGMDTFTKRFAYNRSIDTPDEDDGDVVMSGSTEMRQGRQFPKMFDAYEEYVKSPAYKEDRELGKRMRAERDAAEEERKKPTEVKPVREPDLPKRLETEDTDEADRRREEIGKLPQKAKPKPAKKKEEASKPPAGAFRGIRSEGGNYKPSAVPDESKAPSAGGFTKKSPKRESMFSSGNTKLRDITEGKMTRFAKGGSVGSASKRADGIAMRGKTRGKIC
jgi:hypothetical protein